MMQFETLSLPGLLHITPRRIGDARGYFVESYRLDRFSEHAGDVAFVQDNESLSATVGTIRGIHFQSHPHAQGKLVRCTRGAVYDIAVDLRASSPTFGRWAGVELTADTGNQLWIPMGFGHAFCTLKPDTIVSYKVTDYYCPEDDKGIRWDDPAIGIVWPTIANAETLSQKDRMQPLLTDLPASF